MRLRRLWFYTDQPHSPDDRYAQAEVVKHVMDKYGCYLKHAFDRKTLRHTWVAIYK